MASDNTNPWDEPAQEPGDPAANANPAEAAPADRSPAPPTGPESDPNRNKVIFIAVAVFVVIALVGFLLSRGGNDNASKKERGPSGKETPTQPQANLSITGTIDAFTRADDPASLGKFPNGAVWTAERGTWGIKDNAAYVSNADQERRNIIWVGTGHESGQAQVKISKMVPQAGLVFRYNGPCSYWVVDSVPSVASWNIWKIENCKATKVGNPGQSPIADGSTIGVRFEAKKITIVINGKIFKTIEDATFAGAGKVGMTVRGKQSGEVRFSEFVAGGVKGQAIIVGKSKEPAKTSEPAGGPTTTTKQ